MSWSREEQQLCRAIEEQMNVLVGGLARAQRLSRVKAPDLRSTLEHFTSQAQLLGGWLGAMESGRRNADEYDVEALKTQVTEALDRFIVAARDYRGQLTIRGCRQTWSKYEDRKLRKPLARIVRARSDMGKCAALGRLRSPAAVAGFTRLSRPILISPRQGFNVTIQSGLVTSGTVLMNDVSGKNISFTIDGINKNEPA